jgi:hypothetical protein
MNRTEALTAMMMRRYAITQNNRFRMEQQNEQQPYPHLATRQSSVIALSLLPEVTVMPIRNSAPTATGDRLSE